VKSFVDLVPSVVSGLILDSHGKGLLLLLCAPFCPIVAQANGHLERRLPNPAFFSPAGPCTELVPSPVEHYVESKPRVLYLLYGNDLMGVVEKNPVRRLRVRFRLTFFPGLEMWLLCLRNVVLWRGFFS